jgi:glycosyltransferase involved in cell wall biosynthesis
MVISARMNDRPDLAVMMFDYVPSGVVRNALRIAGAAQQAGLRTEIWTAQGAGDMAREIPAGVEPRALGIGLGEGYALKARKQSLAGVSAPLARMLSELRPRIALSAGNHFHKAAARAVGELAPEVAPRLIGRISNALPRFSWSPLKLHNSVRKRLAVRRCYQAMDRLIAVSAEVSDDLQNKLHVPSSKITTIPNGIDIAEVERLGAEALAHPWFDEGQPPVIVGAGRLVHQKGFDLLLRAFALARGHGPMRLLILGQGPEAARLQALADRLGVTADVQFAGFVPNPMPYIRRAAAFVLPSRWEGLSNALLEAMASGAPVIATRSTGTTELLGGGRFGALVDVGDVDALASSIRGTLANPPPPVRSIGRARDFDLVSTLSAYVHLFQHELPRGTRP